MKGIQHTLLSYAAAAVFLLALWWVIALLLALPIVPTPDKVRHSPGAIGTKDGVPNTAPFNERCRTMKVWLMPSWP